MHLWKNYPQKWLGMDWKDVLLIQKFAIPIKVGGGKESYISGADTRLYDKACHIPLSLSSINLLDPDLIFFAFNVIDYQHNHFL